MKKRDVLLATEAHRPAFNDFADAMRSAESREGWRSEEVLRNFLDAGYRAIRGRLLFGEAFDANEAEYMKIVAACRKPQETMADISRMLGAVGLAISAEPIDFIGPVFSVLSADAGMGQFFTPHHLSYAMAKMIVGDPRPLLEGRRYITLSEPACGVGGMMLATNVVLREAGLDVARQAHWHMVDVDFRAVCGAYIQAAFSDCSAIVVHGNSLSLEVRSSTATPAAALFPKTFREIDPMPAEVVPAPAAAQLTLF